MCLGSLVVGSSSLLTGCLGSNVVEAGTVEIRTQYGEVKELLDPGFGWYLSPGNKFITYDLREQTTDISGSFGTANGAPMTLNLSVVWSVPKDEVIDLYTTVGLLDRVNQQVAVFATSSAKTATAAYPDVLSLLANRTNLENQIEANIIEALSSLGLSNVRVAVRDIDPPKEYSDQIVRTQTQIEAAKEAEARVQTEIQNALANVERANGEVAAAKAIADLGAIGVEARQLENQAILYQGIADALREGKIDLPDTLIMGEDSTLPLLQLDNALQQ